MALIYCPDCNNQISGFAKQCPFCGRPIVSSEPQLTHNNTKKNTETQTYEYDLPPKSWVIESILVSFFCCQPLGIIAIIYAVRVESLWYTGNRNAALQASKDAAMWTKIALFLSLSIVFLYVCFWAVVIFFNISI